MHDHRPEHIERHQPDDLSVTLCMGQLTEKGVPATDKAQYLASLRSRSPDSSVESAVRDDVPVQVYGNTAIVVGVDRVKGKNRGQSYDDKWAIHRCMG